jgi:hypothetical protein
MGREKYLGRVRKFWVGIFNPKTISARLRKPNKIK